MSAETKLVFNKGQLERQLGKSYVDLAHRLGLISQAKVRSDIGSPQNVSVSFYHKSVQELLAAVYMTCRNREAVTLFCKYCSTLEKVWETANITMFVVGLDPSLGCRICKHITNIVNSDTDVKEYRQTLDTGDGRVGQLYDTQCEWYRELTHVRTVTGDTSPPPSIHATDIHLVASDSDTVRLTGDLMSANLGTIVSVQLWDVHHLLHRVVQSLPQCPHLTALCITDMYNKENYDLLVSVIPRLTQLTTVRYNGAFLSAADGGLLSIAAADRAVVAAIMSLTWLVWIKLEWVNLGDDGFIIDDDSLASLGDDGLEVTDAMTRLGTVVLHYVSMTAPGWDRFVSSILALPQSVCVELSYTDIDEGTVRRIQTSDGVTVTRDGGERNNRGRYERLEFLTVPSQTA